MAAKNSCNICIWFTFVRLSLNTTFHTADLSLLVNRISPSASLKTWKTPLANIHVQPSKKWICHAINIYHKWWTLHKQQMSYISITIIHCDLLHPKRISVHKIETRYHKFHTFFATLCTIILQRCICNTLKLPLKLFSLSFYNYHTLKY